MTYRIRNVAIAIGLALVAMLLTLFYVVNYRRSVQHGQATVQVYVAARNIPAGTAGTDIAHGNALKTTSIPRRSVVPGAISDPNQVASLVLTQPLYEGEQVTLRRFSDVKAEGVIGQLKGNQRAIQVPGDATQLLAGTLKDGDHVDLVANLSVDARIFEIHEHRFAHRLNASDVGFQVMHDLGRTVASGDEPASLLCVGLR